MTPNEFKAWLQGIEVVLQGKAPDAALWKLIREQVEKMAAPQPFVMPPTLTPPIFKDPPQRWLATPDTGSPPWPRNGEIFCGELKGDRDAR